MENKPDFLSKLDNLDMEAVTRVARQVKLKEIYLLEAQIHREPFVHKIKSLSLKMDCATRILSSKREETILPVACDFSIVALDKSSSDNTIMTLEASFCANYLLSNSKELPKEDIDHFIKINPLYNVWPYWREFVQSMTIRMGFPPLTVPLLAIVPKEHKTKSEKRLATKKTAASTKKKAIV